MTQRIFIGVAWPYANGSLHIGQLAGAYLPADIFARYHRAAGHEVLMVSGSDAHGTPITVTADREGITPADVVARYQAEFLDSFARLGISFDLFTTTLTENHYRVAQDFWRRLFDNGWVTERTMDLPYDPIRQQFLPDRYVEGECPICHYSPARGDQCDNCGNTLDPAQLINPRSKLSGAVPEIRTANHLFFTLSAFNQALEAWVTPQEHWRKNVRGTTLGWLRDGLRDRAMTRDIDWGIPAPFPGFEDKKIYVWFDAVIGYLSAAMEWAASSGRPEAWRDFWTDPETRSYYFLGKDNIIFHTVIWPAMLMGHGELTLPTDVPANQYVTIGARKASTSQNWAVFVPDYLERFGPEPLRYVLARIMPETSDADFTWEDFVAKNNDELVANWGNLANRVLTLTYRNFDGRVPPGSGATPAAAALLDQARAAVGDAAALLEACQFRRALDVALGLAQATNRFLDDAAPWKTIKDDRDAAGASLASAIGVINTLKLLFWPFLPFSSERLDVMLGFDGDVQRRGWAFESVPAGQTLGAIEPLFVKLDDSIVAEENARLG